MIIQLTLTLSMEQKQKNQSVKTTWEEIFQPTPIVFYCYMSISIVIKGASKPNKNPLSL